MDLYADLPLAKGAAADAVDGDGNSKAAPVWAKGVATAFQPGQRQAPPVAKSVSMLPSSVAGARGKSPVAAAKPAGRGFSLAFRPASLARKAPSGTAATAAARSTEVGHAKPTEAAAAVGDDTSAARGGLGFVAATTWTQVTTVQKDSTEEVAADPVTGDATVANVHFFQATYRDEYHPSRPNNYEAFCEERAAKKKMEQVKRELEERQRQQERESKREREQFAKDVSEGKAPSIVLPMSAGRGRGMTVPAWMRKKIEESGSQAPTAAPVAESVLTDTHETQFENAPPRGGLGFSSGPPQRDAGRKTPSRDEFGRDISVRNDLTASDHDKSEQNRSNRRSRSRSRDRHHQSGSHVSERSVGVKGGARQRSVDHTDGPQRMSHGSQRPGRVILLLNMVGPGEVDDELEQEVKDECSIKYGPVERCVVRELRDRGVIAEEAVRIFVEFRHQSHADQALLGLNSRFFGGRRVKAAYYDEERFARRELSA